MTKPTSSETALNAELREMFERGIAESMDPTNAETLKDGLAVTTLSSRWLHRRCLSCGHTFRLGDEVEISETRNVRHRGGLVCKSAEAPSTGETLALGFFEGLDESWPPPKDVPVIRLENGDRLLAPPLAAFRRHSCAVCGHTLRPLDSVVICPCSPNSPICSVAIHRDPIHGLHCWEEWNPGGTREDCPVTSRVIRG